MRACPVPEQSMTMAAGTRGAADMTATERPAGSRPAGRLARRLHGVGLSVAWVAGVSAAGAVVSMRTAYPRTPQAAPAEGWPPATPVPEGRLAVAVVLGASGSVITDALGPYEVFARSPNLLRLHGARPAARPRCCRVGWPWCRTTRLDDVDAGVAPEPDVVVVPAVAAPNGKKEAAAARVDHPPGRPGSAPPGRVQRLPAARGHGPA